MRTPFDPREHVRQLEDGSEYLDLKWRLLWLRSDFPDAEVETQIVPSGDDEIVCRATVSLRAGGVATGHGSASRNDGDNAVEEAENRALARALASLGYGAEYLDDDHVESPPAPSPPVNLMTARNLLERQEEYEDEPESASPDGDQPDEDEDEAPQQSAPDEPEAPRQAEDISWTKFWEWARARGYRNATELGEMLGVDVTAHTPAEIRRMLKRYELEHPPGGSTE